MEMIVRSERPALCLIEHRQEQSVWESTWLLLLVIVWPADAKLLFVTSFSILRPLLLSAHSRGALVSHQQSPALARMPTTASSQSAAEGCSLQRGAMANVTSRCKSLGLYCRM